MILGVKRGVPLSLAQIFLPDFDHSLRLATAEGFVHQCLRSLAVLRKIRAQFRQLVKVLQQDGAFRIVLSQRLELVPGQVEIHAPEAGHGLAVAGGETLVLLIFLWLEKFFLYLQPALTQKPDHAGASHQATRVSHVGNAGGPGEPVIVDFLAEPHWQDRQGRGPKIIEVHTHEIEEADSLQPVDGHVHAHEPGDGPGCTHQRYVTAHGKRGEHHTRQSTTQQVCQQETPWPQGLFDGKPQQEQEHQVANNVPPTAVEELVGDQRVERKFRWHQPELIGAQPIH